MFKVLEGFRHRLTVNEGSGFLMPCRKMQVRDDAFPANRQTKSAKVDLSGPSLRAKSTEEPRAALKLILLITL